MITLLATALVVCAPGYPGSAAEAQPAMDAFARELSSAAGARITASYEETAEGGLRGLKKPDAALLLATLPFFLAHEKDLHLKARLLAVPQRGQPLEKWTLVAGKAQTTLAGLDVQSLAGWSPRFVRAFAPDLPADAKISASPSVLSGLRKAASGEKVALLLDGSQSGSLSTLPFAQQLKTVSTSEAVPVALVATVGKKLSEAQWKALARGFLAVKGEALASIQMSGFAPLDEEALQRARAAYER